MRKNKSLTGFTLVELAVVIAIMSILSSIILFGIMQYIAKGKDANIAGNLAVLISSGEIYYNDHQNYKDFCESGVVINADRQMPDNENGPCSYLDSGICCNDNDPEWQRWMACVQLFSDKDKAFCVDSRGVKREIDVEDCDSSSLYCPDSGS